MSWTRRAVAPAAGKGGGPAPEFQGQRAAARVPGRVLLLPLENPFGKSEGVRVQTGAEPGDKRRGRAGVGLHCKPPASAGKSQQDLPPCTGGGTKGAKRAGGWVLPQVASKPLSSSRAAWCLGDGGGIPAPRPACRNGRRKRRLRLLPKLAAAEGLREL